MEVPLYDLLPGRLRDLKITKSRRVRARERAREKRRTIAIAHVGPYNGPVPFGVVGSLITEDTGDCV